VWRFPALPAFFKSQWSVGTNNVVLHAALMRFQSDHGLAATGSMTTATWKVLTNATFKHEVSPSSYNVVFVAKSLPQRLKLFQNGRVTFSSSINTGISVAPTASGTYPVYLRYKTTTMSGTLPNGQPYHDTGIPWVSYFNGGDALHGFIRSTYGWPQSLGCVEMPFVDAAALWSHTPIGTLVTVH
jgi:lipoprotein-anchoring transpeptidase ErfK/SrfK